VDLYTCGADLQPSKAVNSFSSLVWTERYSQAGDVVVTAPATDENYALLIEDTFLRVSDSREVMLLDDISIKKDVITAKGSSILQFFSNRPFRETWDEQGKGLLLTNTQIFRAIWTVISYAINPGLMSQGVAIGTDMAGADVFDDLVVLPGSPDGYNDFYSLVVPRGDVYTVIRTLADNDGLGLRLYTKADHTPGLEFSVYRGVDRTTSQTNNIPVVLDPNDGDLTDVETLRSKKTYKNVCYVYPSDIVDASQVAVAYVDGSKYLNRFMRRSMTITASNVKVADYATLDQLKQALMMEGLNALINNNYVKMVDGKMGLGSKYVYGRDYRMGDIVELRNHAGNVKTPARVTEYIRSQDSNGVSAYPTLSVIS
jgi:hypothetical protein